MCGFTGFIGRTDNSSAVLIEMMNSIVHRGPDSAGTFIEDEVALGFRRLSIIDLQAGHQPLYNEDETLVLTVNGEIYNFTSIKEELLTRGHVFKTHSDSEVLLHGYEEYGEKIVEKLRGMFAFVIWDRKNKKLFAGRDMFGIKPFYYSQMNGTLLFGSEIKSLLPHPHFEKQLNEKALKPYLTFQYSVLEETFFKGVFKLPPAHYMIFENGEAKLHRYWQPEFKESQQTLDELVKEIDTVVRESIQAHSMSDVKVGSFLSSGVDSSFVASVLKPDKTFTVGFSDRSFSEIDNAKLLSNELQIENGNKILDSDLCFDKLKEIQYMMDEPHANPSIVPLYFLSELASKDVTVVLSGEGADELFGGYEDYDTPSTVKSYKKLPSFLRQSMGNMARKLPEIRGKNLMIKGGLPVEDWFIGQATIFRESEADSIIHDVYKFSPTINEIVNPYYEAVKNKDELTKKQYLDLHLWLVGDILLKADKMSMAHSLELRVPFLDKKVMEVAAKIPSKFRISEKDTKYAFRLAAAKAMPQEAAKRKKIGFRVPIRNWMKEEKYYLKIKNYFESDEAAQFFKQSKIIKLLDDHFHGKANNGRKVWTVYMFLIWYKCYFSDFVPTVNQQQEIVEELEVETV